MDEEFYKFIEKKREEVDELDIDGEEKERLYNLIEETIVSTGESTTTKPGTYHRFEALEDTICYEIYWVELNHDDIEREDVGGVIK